MTDAPLIAAHAVRPETEPRGESPAQAAAGRAGRDSHDEDVFARIRHALAVTPLLGFDMGTGVIIAGSEISGRVWIRANGETWTLTVLDAATFAIVMRCDAMRGASMFADAFALAAQDAERRVEAIHTWSGRIRPTEDVE